MVKTAVLLATYNGSKLLKPQLDSIKNQSLPADYVLFRDDQSTDATVETVKEYIEINRLKGWKMAENEQNLGWRLNFRALLLDGLKTDADYFFFSDQDNIWNLDKNQLQIEQMELHPEIDVLSADIEVIKAHEGVADLPSWFKYFQFNQNQEEVISKYPAINRYASFRVGWVLVMRRSFIEKLMNYWKSEYNITHDVIVPVLASFLGSGYNLNQIVGQHVLHETNATGSKLLTIHDPKEKHVAELYKQVGFYDVLTQCLMAEKSADAAQMKAYYDFYLKRYQLAKANRFFKVFGQILVDWKYYPGMSGRVRDVIFAFKRK